MFWSCYGKEHSILVDSNLFILIMTHIGPFGLTSFVLRFKNSTCPQVSTFLDIRKVNIPCDMINRTTLSGIRDWKCVQRKWSVYMKTAASRSFVIEWHYGFASVNVNQLHSVHHSAAGWFITSTERDGGSFKLMT